MKKHIFSLAILTLMLPACNFLDKQPDDMRTDFTVWSTPTDVLSYLNNCYANLPQDQVIHEERFGLSDECDVMNTAYATYPINQGNWSATSGFQQTWDKWYRGIRSTLTFEANVDRCTALSPALMKRYKGESKFLRAYYYFLIIRKYGPAVLFYEPLPASTDFGGIPRSSFDECVTYICNLLDEAYELLPSDYVASIGSDGGRANQMTCLATKAEVLLLAASEQWNGNTMYADFKNRDGKELCSKTYDSGKWKKASDAAKAAIDFAEAHPVAYGLYTAGVEMDAPDYNPYKAYYDIFNNGWNCEVIFGTVDNGRVDSGGNSEARYVWQMQCTPVNANAYGGIGNVGVTLRLVDAFYMENGYGIEDPASGYVESGFAESDGPHITVSEARQETEDGRIKLIRDIRNLDAWGHTKGDRNMFAGREARFYASVNYQHRIPLCIGEDEAERNGWSSQKNKDGYGRLECYYGGVSHSTANNSNYSLTGFYPQKHIIPATIQGGQIRLPGKYISIYMRYAGIVLDYIEALNEVNPTDPDIEKYWDLIHKRAGIPSIFTCHPEIRANKDLQREYILRERQIELNFEGDRYYTSHRRLLAGTPDTGATPDTRKWGDGGRMWGLTAFSHDGFSAGNPQTNSFTSEAFYTRSWFEKRVFKDAYYLFPIPQTEIEKSPALVQNPFWD
ncbi:MAG: RagB/SusD family nutrient uptake outer membrane protein [Bacteroidales bacterium]|nr:RagB/SusD family nutrient uptake outer membrane protein [Bacteroidales bacterium]